MRRRALGATGPSVSAVGLGCMSLAGVFGATTEAEAQRTLDAALDHGVDFLDTANVYGAGLSEEILGRWLAARPGAEVVIATKAAIQRDPARPVNNDPSHIRAELDGSLRRLGVDRVDLLYLHRREAAVPLADVIGTFADLVAEGKIAGYGLSEVSPTTLRRAHAIHPCLAVQNEYSLWTRQPELGLLQTCAALGVALVAFSPLARGALGEDWPDPAAWAESDFRRQIPRFSPENWPENRAALAPFKDFARARGWTVAAAALAWLLDRGDHVIPIPGTRTAEHLAEWAGAPEIALTEADRAEIARLLPPGFAWGDRYSDDQSRTPERYC